MNCCPASACVSRPAGRKSGRRCTEFDGKKVREKLGSVAKVDITAARDLAKTSMQKARQGVSPVQERREAAANTLATVVEHYLADAASGRNRKRGAMGAKYLAETRRSFAVDVLPKLGERPIRKITSKDLRALVDGIYDRGKRGVPAHSHANHVCAYVKAFFAWAAKQDDLIDADPAASLRKPAPMVKRDRWLKDREIKVFWQACDAIDWSFGPLYKLLLLTAQRRDELAEATWSEFDLDGGVWTIPGSRTKNRVEHIVHLSPLAIDILRALPRIGDQGWLFSTGRRGDTSVSGWSKAATRLTKAVAAKDSTVEHFTVHDLRRSAASGMAANSIAPPHVIEKILNHVEPGVRGIYNQFQYLSERKEALCKWSEHVASLTLSD